MRERRVYTVKLNDISDGSCRRPPPFAASLALMRGCWRSWGAPAGVTRRATWFLVFCCVLLLDPTLSFAQQKKSALPPSFNLPPGSQVPAPGGTPAEPKGKPWWQLPPPPPQPVSCATDTDCAVVGMQYICVNSLCTLLCDDSDAGVSTLPLTEQDPQIRIPGKVNYYILDVEPAATGGIEQKTWIAKEAKDVCKSKSATGGASALIEQICKASGAGGTKLAPGSTTMPCPIGTTCQWGTDPKTNVTAAWCGPIMIGEPTCDAAKDACCVNGKKTGTDVCLTTPGCQKLPSECPADLCPDVAGIQVEYPEKGADGTGECHAIDEKMCTDPDPEKTYPFATVYCVKGEPAPQDKGEVCTETHLDYCIDATHVLHLVCAPDGTIVPNTTDCPKGALCVNGQCAGKPGIEASCTDSGNDPTKKEWVIGESLATGAGFAKADECQDAGTVIQYTCDPADPKGYAGAPTPCANNEACDNGACKPKEEVTCAESDDPVKKDDVHIKDSVTITFEKSGGSITKA
ncbi:MAG: hypothetical protein HYV03_06420, partial [Deltaproteobacteria bacterium]|nr:hypothetical protein [Deltaproteobacteria bacterium]